MTGQLAARHSATWYLKRYFGKAEYLKRSTSAEDQRKFRTLIKFFRQYGSEYDLPYLLLAAQGYQESQLDQNRRSSAGAVGVMQIKPSTAEGSPVFIKGVDRSVEANIHAGAKYLRWIVDEYYKDEPMTPIDKGLFALASYNAGPGRMNELRRKATKLGLDRNKWFQNVEIVAAREIGRETVQYPGQYLQVLRRLRTAGAAGIRDCARPAEEGRAVILIF